MSYELIDSGFGQKLERFGDVILARPSLAAVWSPKLPPSEWKKAHATFTRDGGNHWHIQGDLPEDWIIQINSIKFKLKRTDFGHLGIFPEQAPLWKWIQENTLPKKRVLNLFAYSGGSSLAAAQAGADVTHLDAAKGMVSWASENAALNNLSNIRWIVEDAMKFLMRACRRGDRYDAIIFDPPSFGRGKSGEIFKIENDLSFILKSCRELLSDNPSFLLFTCHTPGYTPIVMRQLLEDLCPNGKVEAGEMTLSGEKTLVVPCGTYARWTP